MRFKRVFVIGAGGIGSHLLEPLVRMLAYHKSGTKEVMIIDGDVYEEKNRVRQLFDAAFIGHNKAHVLAQRVSASVLPIRHHPEYINREKFLELLTKEGSTKDPILVVTAVDNHATRKAVIEALDKGEFENFVFISGGNGYSNGQILSYVKLRGEAGTVHPFDKYDDLKYPADHIPGDEGCQDEAPSSPQLITANATASLGILLTVQAMLDNNGWYEELHFDTVKMKLVPQGTEIRFPTVVLEAEKAPAPTPVLSEASQLKPADEVLVVAQ